MQRSQTRMTRPSEMSRYLWIIAAMTSDPPELALYCKAMLTPIPNSTPPTTQARNGSLAKSACSANTSRRIDVEEANTRTAKMVLTQNFHPSIFRATKSRIPLMMR